MFEDHKTHSDPVEEVRQTKIEKQQKLLGSTQIHKGHTLFEVNVVEHTIQPAEFEKDVANYNKESKPTKNQLGIVQFKNGHQKVMIDNNNNIRRKVIKKPDCIYISALNKKNLKKKLLKRGVIKIVKR